jgi:DNA recombination protein RmuC
MDPVLLIIILVVGFGALAYLINKKSSADNLLEVIKMLQNSSQADRKVLLDSLHSNSQALNQRLDSVQKNLGEMSEIGRSMRDLQSFLNSPKLRGNVGEQVLKELLLQMLPKNSFSLQYTFRSGEKVDAAITTSAGIIPIDSKFPMENFQKMMKEGTDDEKRIYAKAFERDVKGHIDSIARKYILVDEGTIDYALMYLPSESVYYEVVNNGDLFEYSSSKRVLPVSPTTFYAYMRAILMSFEGQKVEAKAKEILNALRAIQKDYGKVEESMGTLQRHLTNASNTLLTVTTTFSQLGQKISSTRELGVEVKEEVKKLELE